MILSPLYQELLEIWEQLNEELEFTNKKLEQWKIRANLHMIDKKTIGQLIHFHSITGSDLLPIEVKTLLINIILAHDLIRKHSSLLNFPNCLP